jgi:hypothetical protein
MKIHYKHSKKFCLNVVCKLTITDVLTVRIFDVLSEKFNVRGMCTSVISYYRSTVTTTTNYHFC